MAMTHSSGLDHARRCLLGLLTNRCRRILIEEITASTRRFGSPCTVVRVRDEEAGVTTRIELDRDAGLAKVFLTYDKPLTFFVFGPAGVWDGWST